MSPDEAAATRSVPPAWCRKPPRHRRALGHGFPAEATRLRFSSCCSRLVFRPALHSYLPGLFLMRLPCTANASADKPAGK